MILPRRTLLTAASAALALSGRRARAQSFSPFWADIVHIIGYGQSLSMGFHGTPPLSTTQSLANLMLGTSTRPINNSAQTPVSTTWLPCGPIGPNGTYPFTPMIATAGAPQAATSDGETPSEGAVNFLRRGYLAQGGNPACQFVVTNCGIGGKTIAELSKGANPDIYNRVLQAAQQVKASANALGLTYQVGAVIWTQGEQDVVYNTTYAQYLASLQELQFNVNADVVQGIGNASPGSVVPWFCHQPASTDMHRTIAVQQALLDWATTPGSNFYMAGPVYQYPDYAPHLSANGYRWHGNQVGKAMLSVFNGGSPRPLYLTGAVYSGGSLLVSLNVPKPPLLLGADAYVQFTKTAYPNYGIIVRDAIGVVPVASLQVVGGCALGLTLGRALSGSATVQAGYNLAPGVDWGTNICDSDATLANDVYSYTAGVQSPEEDIATWNGAPLIGQPYPLGNYLAVGSVAVS